MSAGQKKIQTSPPSGVNIGIIGGTGGMGRLFKRLWRAQGHRVITASRKTKLTPQQCAKKADLVIVTVPITSTAQVIEKIAPFVRKQAGLADFTSLKGFPTKAMERNSCSEVVGCHPIFAPSVPSLKNQVIVLCPVRGRKWLGFLKESFKKAEAKVKIMNPEEHDRRMAVVQGLIHFTSITLAATIKRMGWDQSVLNAVSSPVYRFRMDFANRILNQDPHLYADIEMMNGYLPDVLKAYEEQTKILSTLVRSKKRKSFIALFKQISDHLGVEKKHAQKRTDFLIRYAAQLK